MYVNCYLNKYSKGSHHLSYSPPIIIIIIIIIITSGTTLINYHPALNMVHGS